MRTLRFSLAKANFKSLARARDGAIVMTATHIFLGGLTIGLGVFRGTESQLSFHHEDLLTSANYGASKLGTDHARSANSVSTNNTISGAVMGPRLSVESANIAVDVTGAIACAACNPYTATMCQLCEQYGQNVGRSIGMLAWSRVKQQMIWTALSTLSGQMDKLASSVASSNIASKIAGVDPGIKMTTEDPSTSQDIWGGDSSTEACSLATKDAMKSPVQDSAFEPQAILNTDLMPGGPTALLAMLGQRICGGTQSGGSAGTGSQPNLMNAVPQVAKDTQQQCESIETQIDLAVQRVRNAFSGRGDGDDSGGDSTTPGVSITPTAQKYVTCNGSSGTGGNAQGNSATSAMFRENGQGCYFDFNKCMATESVNNSNNYLNKMGIPNAVGSGLGGLGSAAGSVLGGGQSTRAPADSNWNQSPSMQACSHATKPVDSKTQTITAAIRQISSFGTADSSSVLTQDYDYASCSKTYFPDGNTAQCAGVQHDEQPFTACWSAGLTWKGSQ